MAAEEVPVMRDAALLQAAREDPHYMDLVIRGSEAFVHLMIRRLGIASKAQERGFDYEDLVQEGRFAVMESVWKWDPERGAFSTFAALTMQHRLMAKILRKKMLATVPLDAPVSDEKDAETFLDLMADPGSLEAEVVAREEMREFMGRLNRMPERLRQVAAMRATGMGQVTIGKQMGISQTTVCRYLKQIREMGGVG